MLICILTNKNSKLIHLADPEPPQEVDQKPLPVDLGVALVKSN